MKKTKLVLEPITFEELFNHPDKEYNAQVWEEYCNNYCKSDDVKLYKISPDKVWGYTRFFKTYKADGINFFTQFSPISGGISNNGFVKVKIIDNVVYTALFRDASGKQGRACNDENNRKLFRLLPEQVYVSNQF